MSRLFDTDRFKVDETPIDGLLVLTRTPRVDARGWFERFYCQDELEPLGVTRPLAQINRTLTAQCGTVRGMHYQAPPHSELKLVSCLKGRIFDVAVDLRQGSPTFGKWYAVELTEDNHRTFLIPEGFAHGFQTLTADCMLLYLHTAAHAPMSEGGLRPNCPTLAIDWPEPIIQMSDRDRSLPVLKPEFAGLAP